MPIQIQDKAYDGLLAQSQVKQYFSDNPSHLNVIGGKINLTPLCAACLGGHLDVVKHILSSGADPNIPSQYKRTPLFWITDPRCKAPSATRCAIIRELISGKRGLKADLNKPCDEDMNTPLMNAITQLNDKTVIEQLVESGASVTIQHYPNQPTAKELGEEHGLAGCLISKSERDKALGVIIDHLVTLMLLVIAYFNNKSLDRVADGIKEYFNVKEEDIPKDLQVPEEVKRKTVGEIPKDLSKKVEPKTVVDIPKDLPELPTEVEPKTVKDIPKDLPKIVPPKDLPKEVEPKTVAEFQTFLNSEVQQSKFEKFFAPNAPFLATLAENANKLKDDPTTDLGKPENIKRLIRLSFYHPIIYCDDSGSMNCENRFGYLIELVTRIARVATKIVPHNMAGVDLRFINNNLERTLSAEHIQEVMKGFKPSGTTPIGTNLRKRILKPLVYDNIDQPKLSNKPIPFERPLLVCIITDGCPSDEPPKKFRDEIITCKQKLAAKYGDATLVMFCISQVGTDQAAERFLDALRNEKEIEDVIHCTVGQLDAKYKELKENERALESWLLQMLTNPIMQDSDT